ncbi:hypothetical protein BU25DRAFT_472946 [Macroventuria anomochaeta]|uniref:Uncharacterized protein n=1 Tax=Macroventuria anomochaeta TaxID=301207 RepID=A0ACB6RXP0_9PLEO|nr:uncharacterized protein BU25DRAFT_472946 [Macroventuria anomochaeta]KAF2625657.1 hypothetical protein BU25DRAFT_472946 [Macroventuria anomochaeta]
MACTLRHSCATNSAESLNTIALTKFHETYARNVFPLEDLDEADDFLYQHTGQSLTSTGWRMLYRPLVDDRHSYSRIPPNQIPYPQPGGGGAPVAHSNQRSVLMKLLRAILRPVSHQSTNIATEQRSTPATGRGRTGDTLQQGRLDDQRWNAGRANNQGNVRVTNEAQDGFHRAQLHDQRWNAGITSGTVNSRVANEPTQPQLTRPHESTRVESQLQATHPRMRQTSRQQTELSRKRPANNHRAQQQRNT